MSQDQEQLRQMVKRYEEHMVKALNFAADFSLGTELQMKYIEVAAKILEILSVMRPLAEHPERYAITMMVDLIGELDRTYEKIEQILKKM